MAQQQPVLVANAAANQSAVGAAPEPLATSTNLPSSTATASQPSVAPAAPLPDVPENAAALSRTDQLLEAAGQRQPLAEIQNLATYTSVSSKHLERTLKEISGPKLGMKRKFERSVTEEDIAKHANRELLMPLHDESTIMQFDDDDEEAASMRGGFRQMQQTDMASVAACELGTSSGQENAVTADVTSTSRQKGKQAAGRGAKAAKAKGGRKRKAVDISKPPCAGYR